MKNYIAEINIRVKAELIIPADTREDAESIVKSIKRLYQIEELIDIKDVDAEITEVKITRAKITRKEDDVSPSTTG